MKTFFNVLYRRILYKIPLKFLLLLVAIFGILFACFSSATDVEDLISRVCPSSNPNCTYFKEDVSFDTNITIVYDFGSSNPYAGKTMCVKATNWSTTSVSDVFMGFGTNTNNSLPYASQQFYNNGTYEGFQCFFVAGRYLKGLVKAGASPISFDLELFVLEDLLTTALPEMTSLECQTNYNLIPISSVDQNYCVNNNLCPSSDCPPSGGSGFSNVYINDILHVGAPNIVMNIADEIDWDYEYTAGGYNMNIDVVGYNVDYEKIDSIVQFQNYKPSSDDFQRIIGLLAPYTKIIVFFVFLFIIWAWIKKPFRSKKL